MQWVLTKHSLARGQIFPLTLPPLRTGKCYYDGACYPIASELEEHEAMAPRVNFVGNGRQTYYQFFNSKYPYPITKARVISILRL